MLMTLPVLPPPFSTTIYPELTDAQRGEFRRVLKMRGYPCYWCGRPIGKRSRTLDHIIPRSRGGLNTVDNLVPCCGPCNCHKDNFELDGWLHRLEHIVERLRQSLPEGAQS